MTSAPTGKSGRFSRVLSAVRFVVIFYVLLYAAMVIGGYGWLTLQKDITLPQGAGFAFSTQPPGLALDVPEIKTIVKADMPVTLQTVRHVWPILTPWRTEATAASGSLQISHFENHDQLDAQGVKVDFTLPFTVVVTATSLDWRIVFERPKEGQVDADPTTLVSPRFTYSRGLFGLNGPAERAEFAASPIMLPTSSMNAVVQVDNLKFRLVANRTLPDDVSRTNIAAWQKAGGRVSLEDFTLSVIGMDLLMAGDVGLSDVLDLDGNLQLQLSGLGTGYSRLGQLNIIPPQHYRLLGYVLQAMPQAGQQTFTMPVKIQRSKVYIGPAAAFSFGIMPWQTATDMLLNTPVAGSKADAAPTLNTPITAPIVEPQGLAPVNTVSVPVAPTPKAAETPTTAPAQ